MGDDVKNFYPGGGICLDLRNILPGDSLGNHLVWIRDLGDDLPDWEDPWRIPQQIGPLIVGDELAARHSRAVRLPYFRGGDSVIGPGGGGDIRPTPS